MQNNRREGLKEFYLSDPVTYVQYQAYESQDGGDAQMPAGILGPIQLTTADESVAEPGETPARTPTPAPTSDPTSSPASTMHSNTSNREIAAGPCTECAGASSPFRAVGDVSGCC